MVYRTLELLDGRIVGYETYGADQGPLVFALHGTPTCGLAFQPLDECARRLGVRLIAPDRPGIRSSTAKTGYRVVDVGFDMVAAADLLGEERFGVLGWSGGGPYALATAAVGDSRLLGVVVAAGMGPPDTPEAATDYSGLDLQMLRWSREKPRLARAALGTLGVACRLTPGMASKSFSEDLSPRDKEVYEAAARGQIPREPIRFVSEAFRGGAGGVVADYAALSSDWGFRLQDISVLVHIWQGDNDRMVPPVHARNLASRLSTRALIQCPGEGHLLVLSHKEEMLRQSAALEPEAAAAPDGSDAAEEAASP